MFKSKRNTRFIGNEAAPLGAMLALLLVLSPVDAGAAEVAFSNPTSGDNYRVDICLEWGMQCAGEAANMWCIRKGYDRALEWAIDYDIGATNPTIVIGSGGKICSEAHCDGYSSITCSREDTWTSSTGNSGLLVEVIRSSSQSTEGVLVVAVSQQDLSQATAAVANVNGLALLHTPPGNWYVFLQNFKNAQQIPSTPGSEVDVQAGPHGGFMSMMPD